MASQTKVTKSRTSDGGLETTRTTTYEKSSRTSYESDGDRTYRAHVAPRTTIIQRTVAGGPGHGHSQMMQKQASYGMMAAVPSGAYANVAGKGVTDVKTSRDREKKDMQDLNERFANYIEKVRFLEAQNRKLASELENLKAKWGKETTAIKAMYQAELDEARRLLDEAEKEKSRYMLQAETLEEQLQEMRQRLDDTRAERDQAREALENQNRSLADLEAECNLLRKRIESLESDRERDRREIQRLTDALNRARIDLDNETLAHIDAENRRQTLEEEIEFLKNVHEQEMKELAALAYRDTTQENREFWKSEMSGALREISQAYDGKLDDMRAEMETYYNMKVQEFRTGATRQNMETSHAKEETKRLRAQLSDLRSKLSELESRNAMLEKEMELLRREYEEKEREWETENTELKNEVAKLRAEMEAILKELQDLMDTKLGLELEIAAYRKLLEGEENRIGLKQVVDSWVSSSNVESTEDSSLKVSQVVKGEMSAKTTYQRSAKGPVSISECAADGKFITLENNGRKDESLGSWRIKRNIDGIDRADITLDQNTVLRPGQKLKLWASRCKPAGSGNDRVMEIEVDLQSWGLGANITTKLINPAGEDRATHLTKTVYTS
jgi:intermediate filament protein if